MNHSRTVADNSNELWEAAHVSSTPANAQCLEGDIMNMLSESGWLAPGQTSSEYCLCPLA